LLKNKEFIFSGILYYRYQQMIQSLLIFKSFKKNKNEILCEF